MERGSPGLNDLPGQLRIAVIDAHRFVVSAVDTEVDHFDVGWGTEGHGGRRADRLRNDQGK
jgi:hypothetical protein